MALKISPNSNCRYDYWGRDKFLKIKIMGSCPKDEYSSGRPQVVQKKFAVLFNKFSLI
jgi:hypothetical protein